MTAVKNENLMKSAISGVAAHDSRKLEKIFEICRQDEKKMTLLCRAFCEAYLIDNKQRPLKLRPLQEQIVVKILDCYILINRNQVHQCTNLVQFPLEYLQILNL